MELSEIKSRLPISTVLKHYHLQCDRHHRLRCPFHEDKTPSMQVYPKTGTWTCFSSNCTAGSGEQVDFIMPMEGISKHEAILKAKEMAGHMDPTPLQKISSPKGSPLSLEQRTRILTEEEIMAMYDATCFEGHFARPGTRSLQRDIDLESGMILIRKKGRLKRRRLPLEAHQVLISRSICRRSARSYWRRKVGIVISYLLPPGAVIASWMRPATC